MEYLSTQELIDINGGSPRSFGQTVGCAVRCYFHAVSDFWRGFWDEL